MQIAFIICLSACCIPETMQQIWIPFDSVTLHQKFSRQFNFVSCLYTITSSWSSGVISFLSEWSQNICEHNSKYIFHSDLRLHLKYFFMGYEVCLNRMQWKCDYCRMTALQQIYLSVQSTYLEWTNLELVGSTFCSIKKCCASRDIRWPEIFTVHHPPSTGVTQYHVVRSIDPHKAQPLYYITRLCT
jgi:hypothetical protein